MAGPAPIHQPVITTEEATVCRDLLRRQSAAPSQVYRARLALLLHENPALDSVAAGRQLRKHPTWVRYWRRSWATDGFRLTDRPGRGRKPRVSPPAAGDGGGVGLRVARPA